MRSYSKRLARLNSSTRIGLQSRSGNIASRRVIADWTI